MLIGNDSHMILDPMRVLALYLASYVDTWDSLVTLHTNTLAQFPPSVDDVTLIKSVAPALEKHLTHSEQASVNSHDMLLHTLVQSSIEAFSKQTPTIPPCVHEITSKINNLPSDSQKLIIGYYKNKLRGDSLANYVGMEVKELPAALCRLRTTLDWVNQNGVWQAAPGESLLPALIHEFINGSIDQDSRELLAKASAKDLKNIAGLQRQWRMHLLLIAMYVVLPFPPRKKSIPANVSRPKDIVYAQKAPSSGVKSVISRPKKESSISNRTVVVKAHTHVTWLIAGGCLVTAVILSFYLWGNNDVGVSNKPPIVVEENNPSPSPNNNSADDNPADKRIVDNTSPITPPPPQGDASGNESVITTEKVSNPAVPSTIDLLSLVDLKRDVVHGSWQVGPSKSLVVVSEPDEKYLRLSLPYIPPPEYDMRVTYAYNGKRPDFICLLNYQGTQCVANISGYNGEFAGFAYINNTNINRNKSRVSAPKFEKDKTYTLEVRVRKRNMELYFEDKLLTTFSPDMGQITLTDSWTLKNNKVIGIGIYQGDFTIHAITIREITGSGQILQSYSK